MKYIALTFDDGREDTASVAYPILERYGMKATLFVTTGYLDHTWTRGREWRYAGEPMTLEQLGRLRDAGWEIGLHGDQHRTALADWQDALMKLRRWGFRTERIGGSLPDSRADEAEIRRIVQTLGEDTIAYIRRGRACDTRRLGARVLFAAYTCLKAPWAYRCFNRENLTHLPVRDKTKICSVVIRHRDTPEMLLKFLDTMADQTLCVLMLHSILPETHENYGKDPWNWSEQRFERLCGGLRERSRNGTCCVQPLSRLV